MQTATKVYNCSLKIFFFGENLNCMTLDIDIDMQPGVIPLHSYGVVDINGHDVTERELMAAAIANAVHPSHGEEFAIRRGSTFVNKYPRTDDTGKRVDGGPDNANHLLGCFPTLFPYGRGGLEVDRPCSVSYKSHARWAIQYADKRFRKDLQFPFQVFGVCRKCQVCRSAVLYIKKDSFIKHHNILTKLTVEDLLQASKEEEKGQPFSKPSVNIFRQQLKAIRTKVKGTDESRVSIRSKIWSSNLIFNPPCIWLTINPSEADPIVQIFCGSEIDLENFVKTAGPMAGE